jgi:hypothetical protein
VVETAPEAAVQAALDRSGLGLQARPASRTARGPSGTRRKRSAATPERSSNRSDSASVIPACCRSARHPRVLSLCPSSRRVFSRDPRVTPAQTLFRGMDARYDHGG